MEYNIDAFVSDFAQRTMFNNKVISNISVSDNKKDILNMLDLEYDEERIKGPFEVTQLINSLFGLIIIPTETFESKYDILKNNPKYKMNCKPIENKVRRFLRELEDKHCYFTSYSGYRYDIFYVTKHLKNSLSHSGKKGLHFYPISDLEKKNISHILFYDTDKYSLRNNDKYAEKNIHEFCIKLRLNKLKQLIELIYLFYKELDSITMNNDDYIEEIKALEYLLKRENNTPIELDAFDCYKEL